jgi:hypothetical protein
MNNHLTREQMLAYLDGEVPKTQTAAATGHLHSCWTCRIEMERLESDIAVILDAHNESFVPTIPPPPGAWPPFDALLARKLPEVPQPVWMRIGNAMLGVLLPAKSVILAGLIAGLAIFALFKSESRPVSAKEVLRSVQAADNQRMRIPQGRVLRERVHVRRKVRGQEVGTGSVNVWKSPIAAVWQASDGDSAVAALKQEYGTHGVPVDLPLSASSIAAWGGVAGGEPSAEKQGNELNLTFPGGRDNSSGEFTRMSLRIRPGTWHVEAMTLQFSDDSFEVTEDEFSTVPTNDVPPVLLAELEPGPQLSASAVAHPVSDAMASPIPLPEINLDKVQLHVLLALHHVHADLGEPISVTHSSRKIEVGIWQLPPDRQNEIRAALQDEPGVVIQTTPPAQGAMLTAAATPGSVPLPASTRITVPSDGEDQRLTKFFGGPDKEQAFTRGALSKSTNILAHLYALRNLQAQFPPEREQALSPIDREHLASIIEDHAAAVEASLRDLQDQLAPLDGAFSVAVTTSGSELDHSSPTRWQDASLDALGTARNVDYLLRGFLTTSETPAAPDAALPEVQQKLSHLFAEMHNLQKK